MTATYDRAEVERLVREARERAERLNADIPACTCDGWPHAEGCAEYRHLDALNHDAAWTRANLRAMADQLEAARVRVAELEIALRGAEAAASHYQREVWKLAEMHNERAGRVASLESDLARLRSELDTEARANNPDVTIPASTSPA